MLQARYSLNRREDVAVDEEKVTQGFTIPRARLWLNADVTQYLTVYIRMGVNSGGEFGVENAFGDLHLGDFTLRAGQFGLPIFAEADNVIPSMTLGTDFSVLDIAFDPGAAQGVLFKYNPERLRLRLAYTNGLRTGFSDFGDTAPAADFAVTAVGEGFLLGSNWGRLADFTSFRGQSNLLKVGAGVHYQNGGDTGETIDLGILYVTSDIRAEGNGWNLFGQMVWSNLHYGANVLGPGFPDTYNDLGFTVQGGVFALRWLEPYLRYDHIIPDGEARPEENRGPATSEFRALTTGVNGYLFPGTHLARMTLEFQYMFDGQAESLVPVVPVQGILATEDDQWCFRTQFVFHI